MDQEELTHFSLLNWWAKRVRLQRVDGLKISTRSVLFLTG